MNGPRSISRSRTIRLEPEQTKTDEARVLPLPPVLVAMLKGTEPKTGKVFDGTNLRKEWMTACDACGLGTKIEVEGKPYDPHYEGLTFTICGVLQSVIWSTLACLRRVAMRISGHKTRSVFDRYAIVSDGRCEEAMQRVETAADLVKFGETGAYS